MNKQEQLNNQTFSSSHSLVFYQKVGLTEKETKILKKHMTVKGSLLDIGCGCGRTTIPLAESGFDVIGIDISDEMIDNAKRINPDVDFRVGDACDLMFTDNSFDYVLFSFNGLDCIFPEERRITAIKEIYRVLKPGGLFIFSSHNSNAIFAKNLSFYYWLLKFHVYNAVKLNFFSKYKYEKTSYGELYLYFTSPREQQKQLHKCNFQLIDVVGNFQGKLKYLENWPYYIAQKPI